MSEINVTPFVDVMLCLLIIFMVAAPLLSTGVPVELPKADAQALKATSDKEPLAISVKNDGKVFLQETEVPPEEIVAKLTAIAGAGYEETIFIRGDARTNYGALMQVMARVSQAGFRKISLVTAAAEEK